MVIAIFDTVKKNCLQCQGNTAPPMEEYLYPVGNSSSIFGPSTQILPVGPNNCVQPTAVTPQLTTLTG